MWQGIFSRPWDNSVADIVGTPADPTDFAPCKQQVMDAVRELVVEKITLLAVYYSHLLLAWVFYG